MKAVVPGIAPYSGGALKNAHLRARSLQSAHNREGECACNRQKAQCSNRRTFSLAEVHSAVGAGFRFGSDHVFAGVTFSERHALVIGQELKVEKPSCGQHSVKNAAN
jgi:hypothetical protein